MNKLIALLLIVLSIQLNAQSKAFKNLGGAEKLWVVFHPFSAKKAYRLSQKTLHVTDSIQPYLRQQFNGSGSKLDAFKHAYWMSLLSSQIGPKRALWLGKAHEKKNKKDFENSRVEDGSQIDQMTIQMDLENNELGVRVGKYCKKCTKEKLRDSILEALESGELKIIRHNYSGQFLDDNNQVIPNKEWQGKFENKRNLVPSNFAL